MSESDTGSAAKVEGQEEASPRNVPEEKRCPVGMFEGGACGRPVYNTPVGVDGELVCLMHSSDPNKDQGAFWEEFERILKLAGEGIADFSGFVFPEADFRDRTFTPRCIFRGAMFTRRANFLGAMFTQEADFWRATFKQKTVFGAATFTQEANFSQATFTQRADFGGATFTQSADFSSAQFSQRTDFSYSRFAQIARFTEAEFGQIASFSNAKFENYCSFSQTTFRGTAFRQATFTQGASFGGATFTQGADFFGATFTQRANFAWATFTQRANFLLAKFTQGANFARATFTKGADFTEARFTQEADFRRATFTEEAEFRETVFPKQENDSDRPGAVFTLARFEKPEEVIFYQTDLSRVLFHNCDVSKFLFSNVTWRKRPGNDKNMVFDEVVSLENENPSALRLPEDSPDERNYSLVAELYQQLKKNYDDRRDYWTAGDFHYGEMELKRQSSRRRNPLLRWWHRNLGLAAWYKYASEYGENYLRPVGWLLVVVALLAYLFPMAGLSPRISLQAPYQNVLASATPKLGYWQVLDHSLLTALSVAAFQREFVYEPIYPWGLILRLLELPLTSTLLALFLLAVRRHCRR